MDTDTVPSAQNTVAGPDFAEPISAVLIERADDLVMIHFENDRSDRQGRTVRKRDPAFDRDFFRTTGDHGEKRQEKYGKKCFHGSVYGSDTAPPSLQSASMYMVCVAVVTERDRTEPSPNANWQTPA